MKAMIDSGWGMHDYKERGKWTPQRVEDQVAVDSAAAMVDRFNQLFLQTLGSPRGLRRYTVVVQNACQLNIGVQQVNITDTAASEC